MSTPVEPEPSQSDEAARAGWMYYVGGMTQDHIARELGVSRQRAQRLVSRAMAEGLIHVRLNHRIASCLALEKALTERFSLLRCRVVPSLGAGADPVDSIAPAAAAELERFLRLPDPLVIALGTGRALRAMVDSVAPLEAEQHRLVSLIGNIAPDGSSSFFEVIMRLADKVRAPHYPMPVPVVTSTPEENAAFHALAPVRRVVDLARSADVTFVGVGQMGSDAPLRQDGFVTDAELSEMQNLGAVGEIAGWSFDSAGLYIEVGTNSRVGGVRVRAGSDRPVIGVAGGGHKVAAITAALKSRIINGLITDELTASEVLSHI